MSKREISLLIDDMLQSAYKINSYTEDMDFIKQLMRLLEILKSLVKQLIEFPRHLEY